jgi:hypothetical protein
MSNVTEIERAVRDLSPGDLARFRAWFLDFEARSWDREFEADVAAGRLDELAAEAVADHREGRTRRL